MMCPYCHQATEFLDHECRLTKRAERRRYALLQAAATMLPEFMPALNYQPKEACDEAACYAEYLLTEIERREKETSNG